MATSIATRGAVPGPPRGLGAATRRIAHRRSRSRFGTLLLRAEKDDDDAAPSQGPEDDPRSPANLMRRAMSMRAKNIKVKLASLGVSSKDLFEKEELARALANAWGEKLKGTVTLPLRQLVGMPGNPRAGYVIVTLDVGEAGFVDFLIDSGATNTFVTSNAPLTDAVPGDGFVTVANGRLEKILESGRLGPLVGAQRVNGFRRTLVSVRDVVDQFGEVAFDADGVRVTTPMRSGSALTTRIGSALESRLYSFDVAALQNHADRMGLRKASGA